MCGTRVNIQREQLEQLIGFSKMIAWHWDELYDSVSGSITIVGQKRVAAPRVGWSDTHKERREGREKQSKTLLGLRM